MRALLLILFIALSTCLNAQTFSDYGNYQVNSRKELIEMKPIDKKASTYWNNVFHMVTYQASNVELQYMFQYNDQLIFDPDSIIYSIRANEYRIYNKIDSTFVMVTMQKPDLEIMIQHLRLELALIKYKNHQKI